MNLSLLGALAFSAHALIMGIDEILHRRRGLARWERLGHPLDTLTVLLCVLFPMMASYSPFNGYVYLAMAVFSSVFVTKDEWIHKEKCGAFEQWLHALLFLLHPVLLGFIFIYWKEESFPYWFKVIPLAIITLGLYQLLYWNLLRKNYDQ